MDTKKIKELINILEESKLETIEVSQDNFSIKMTKTNTNIVTPTIINKTIPEEINNVDESNYLKAPIVGTLYLSSNSDKEAYVKVNQKVNKGDTICIIEAMKVMNEIAATKSGVVKEILGVNEQLVEFDQPLFIIE